MTNKHLQIAHIEYSMNTKSLDIFTIGCNGFCKGCCNPEIKNWDVTGINIEDAIKKIKILNKEFDKIIDRIIIVGGDPVDAYKKYPLDLKELLNEIKTNVKKPIFLFTRYDFWNIPKDILDRVDYVKTGEYKPELTTDNNICYGIKLATENQIIWKKNSDNSWS